MKKIIIGIDPGYDRLGLAILEKSINKEEIIFSDCFLTSSKETFHKRLLSIGEHLEKILKDYQPDILSIEKVFFQKNQKTVMNISAIKGMIIYLALKKTIIVKEYTPLEIKSTITGYGNADKKQMKTMLDKILKINKKIKYDDEYDAIGAALTASARLAEIQN